MKYILVANWKMHPATYKDAKKLLEVTKSAAESAKNLSVVVAPPSIYLRELRAAYKGRRLTFAAQSSHFEKDGSFTGEISPAQLKDSRASYVLVGHAERRAAGETDEDTRKKVLAVFEGGMIPILCVGEKKRGQDGAHFTFVRGQLSAALRELPHAKIGRLLIAYEPVWAIGSERAMGPREMHEMVIFIRKTIVEMHGAAGMNTKVLYGGAIDETNAAPMLSDGGVSGLLVGRASANPFKIKALIEAVAEIEI
jgi:triosephosphate isomerase (TIM)